MLDHRSDAEIRSARPSRGFVVYATLIAVGAAASVAALIWMGGWRADSSPRFWMLALFVLVGELLAIPVPRRRGLDKVTISTAFAFALLLCFGAVPAALVYAASSVFADVWERTAAIKVVFNAAQYVLAMVVAAAVLALAGSEPPVPLTGGHLPVIFAAGGAFFLANHALAGSGAAVLARLPVAPYLRDDFAFQVWTAGGLIALAPAVVASANANLALVPVSFVPMLAILAGGRQAAENRDRALHDPLTGLPNRSMLTEWLRGALVVADREATSVAVMIVDLDDFKSINDTLGHEFGDVVLRDIALRLEGAVGTRGMLARLGGDEFAVVLEGVRGEADAAAAARRLLGALDRSLEVDSLALHVTASIGIACFPQHGRTVPELLRHADVALYRAKGSDPGFVVYADEPDEYSPDRLALAAQLRAGIARGELIVHYQPKVSLHGDGTRGVEALVRWNHPQLGCLGPNAFISLAEQTGVMKLLTEHVLEAALGQCDTWRREGMPVRVSVNISSRSLLDHDLPATILALLERFELPGDALQLEITESRIVADMGRAPSVLADLRALGVTFAIDDFGTGFSSLSQLQQLPVDEIKIDRSFVSTMETNADDAVLVRSIIELGRNLGLHVTAEGVESETVMRSLLELGCDFAQGFHIGRPGVAEECRRILKSGDPTCAKPAAVIGAVHPEGS